MRCGQERGFNLVELMVAMTIGLIILAAVSTLFVSSRTTYRAQDSMARLQENARFAMHFLTKDLRLAGYYGCMDEITPQAINVTVNNPTSFSYNAQTPIEGLDGAAGTPSWYPSGAAAALPVSAAAGSDAVALRFADPNMTVDIADEMPNTSAEIKVSSVSAFSQGDVIMISDCSSADVMQVTQVQTASTHLQHAPGGADPAKQPPWPGNATQKLQKAYGPPGAQIMHFVTRRYYVATGASGNPALFRDQNGGPGQELVEGVEMIKILYGRDTNSDRVPDRYVKAGSTDLDAAEEWSSVVSVRVGVLLRTLEINTDTDSQSYDIDGDGTNDYTAPGDRYSRRFFTSTVLLRNLQ
jgi:type IV pilus assembly protein PilW